MKLRSSLLPFALLALAGCGDAETDRSDPAEPTYSVVMMDGGNTRVAVIKAVREVTGLGLHDAKELVDSTPSVVLSELSQDAAKAVAEKLVGAGAKVELERN